MASINSLDKRFFLMVTPSRDIGYVQSADISRTCNVCGEGRSHGQKHRLHLYIKDTYDSSAIACFNCGYTGNMFSYLRDFFPEEYSLYKKEKQGNSFKELKLISQPKVSSDFTIKNFMEEPSIPQEPKPLLIDPVKGLLPLPESVLTYLNKRGLKPEESWLYSPENNKVMFNERETLLSDMIIVPLIIESKWYGFQAIGYKEKKFLVYLVNGNTSWKIENWDYIDKSQDVFLMESVFDRLSTGIKNSLAVLGSNIHSDRLQELSKPIFCLDNQNIDEKSKQETLRYLESGYRCFIWPKKTPNHIKDFNDLRKLAVPMEKIENMIKTNIFQGMQGILKIKML